MDFITAFLISFITKGTVEFITNTFARKNVEAELNRAYKKALNEFYPNSEIRRKNQYRLESSFEGISKKLELSENVTLIEDERTFLDLLLKKVMEYPAASQYVQTNILTKQHDRIKTIDSKISTGLASIDELKVNTSQILDKLSNKQDEKIVDKRCSEASFDSEPLIFVIDVIVCYLPRGYIILNLEKHRKTVVADYVTYSGISEYGTHYNSGYARSWMKQEVLERQLRQLNIPKGDWYYGESVLYLMMELAETNIPIVDFLKLRQSSMLCSKLFLANHEIPKPQCPQQFEDLSSNGLIRDLIEDLYPKNWSGSNLNSTLIDIEHKSRKAYLFLHDKLAEKHPMLTFVKDIQNQFDLNFEPSELTLWCERFQKALSDSLKYT